MPRDLTYLSLGLGVQSTALLAMSCHGIRGCPKADVAIFADTQSEPQWVYDQLEAVKKWSTIPIEVVTTGSLEDDSQKARVGTKSRVAFIPTYTAMANKKSGTLLRQCTHEYKIRPINRHIKKAMGYEPRQRVKHKAQALIGISVDEIGRIKPSRRKWIDHCYPLIEAGMTREGCKALLTELGLPIPRKSSCYFCPYHDDAFWDDMKQNYPHEWQRAVEFDHAIRDTSRSGVKNPVFLHRSLVPLDMVQLKPKEKREALGLFDSFGEECTGMCGV